MYTLAFAQIKWNKFQFYVWMHAAMVWFCCCSLITAFICISRKILSYICLSLECSTGLCSAWFLALYLLQCAKKFYLLQVSCVLAKKKQSETKRRTTTMRKCKQMRRWQIAIARYFPTKNSSNCFSCNNSRRHTKHWYLRLCAKRIKYHWAVTSILISKFSFFFDIFRVQRWHRKCAEVNCVPSLVYCN